MSTTTDSPPSKPSCFLCHLDYPLLFTITVYIILIIIISENFSCFLLIIFECSKALESSSKIKFKRKSRVFEVKALGSEGFEVASPSSSLFQRFSSRGKGDAILIVFTRDKQEAILGLVPRNVGLRVVNRRVRSWPA
ncbi:hypothetical protein PIB30_046640, partial [Stylosanthes scabra]|nr:hypothetical protein [Stylosanthes scabra]